MADAKTPKSICFEVDLYTLPKGGVANGLAGAELESTLASTVDDSFAESVALASSISGPVNDAALEARLIWLMRTFIARSPGALCRVEAGLSELVAEQHNAIEACLARANLESTRHQLRSFQDPRHPRVASLAGLTALATNDVPKGFTWLDGDVHVIRAGEVRKILRGIGAGEFVTFENPVVEWESPPGGPVASFVLSPAALLAVFPRGKQATASDYGEVANRHSLTPLRYRENLICRTKVTGLLLTAAGELQLTRS